MYTFNADILTLQDIYSIIKRGVQKSHLKLKEIIIVTNKTYFLESQVLESFTDEYIVYVNYPHNSDIIVMSIDDIKISIILIDTISKATLEIQEIYDNKEIPQLDIIDG